jgi:hypothetical protein
MENGTTNLKTHFAPAERASPADVAGMSRFVSENPLFRAVMESVDGYLMILNPERQVLAANQRLVEELRVETVTCLLGERPGEVLGCIHAAEEAGGCGTAQACQACGVVISILASQRDGRPATGECLATVRHGGVESAREFRVRATPVQAGGHDFTVLVFQDISGDKRREALERVFFHDVMNTIGGLMGWSQLLQQFEGVKAREAAGHVVALSQRLKREIEDQRRLSQAELGALEVAATPVPVFHVLETVRMIFEAHDAAEGRTLEIAEADPEADIVTDSSLLVRVLTNMVKNALEASRKGETVRLWHALESGRPVFRVHNGGAIPEEVRLRIFQRSFSTKSGRGRGIGTYSMKLFGERYLGGQVGFESSEAEGTVFFIKLPETSLFE